VAGLQLCPTAPASPTFTADGICPYRGAEIALKATGLEGILITPTLLIRPYRHCEERSDEAIYLSASKERLDCFDSLAMTV
jgi:hypothetical protein